MGLWDIGTAYNGFDTSTVSDIVQDGWGTSYYCILSNTGVDPTTNPAYWGILAGGASGISGFSGKSGFSGLGISGFSGYSSTSGFSGYSGLGLESGAVVS